MKPKLQLLVAGALGVVAGFTAAIVVMIAANAAHQRAAKPAPRDNAGTAIFAAMRITFLGTFQDSRCKVPPAVL